nr:integrase, catalytic region, zinc finger, CCHC-type, peptidase aspartic, catalytic [Tanacetum cinerariifolium]
MGYGDYQMGNVTISRVYYVEGLGHNLFSIGQFCDSDLEVAFRQHTCFIRNLEGVDLLTGSQGNNLYTLSLQDMMASSPICLLSKASKTKSWLWHLIRDPQEEFTTSTIVPAETKSKDKGKGILVEKPKPLKKQAQIEQDEQYARELEAELNKTIDWDEAIDHVKKKAKEDPAVKRYQVLKRKPQTEAQARKNMMVYLKNVVGFKMDYFKGMSYDDICPIFEAKFNTNVAFLQKTKEQIEEEESRALKRLNETPTEKAAK